MARIPPLEVSLAILSTVSLVACGSSPRDDGFLSGGGSGAEAESSSGDDEGSGGSDDATGTKLDVGSGDGGADVQCDVDESELDAPPPCGYQAPPDAFSPEVEWTFTPSEPVRDLFAPLVGNLTDDNGDGAIDLCDTPDIVVTAALEIGVPGITYVLDGATGEEHFRLPVAGATALGDIDGDGTMEIVVFHDLPELENGDLTGIFDYWLTVFEHDGSEAWTIERDEIYPDAPALADLDADGDVELAAMQVYDHQGNYLWTHGKSTSTQIADLDGDGMQEIVTGYGAALRADGSLHFYADVPAVTYWHGVVGPFSNHVAIADLDDDPDPEILLVGDGITILEHDGAVKMLQVRTFGDYDDLWAMPVVHDFDGDGRSEFATSGGTWVGTFEGDGTPIWTRTEEGNSEFGDSALTAFDFLGDGSAELVLANRDSGFSVLGATGETYMHLPDARGSGVPVIADVDNDGSAEILALGGDEYMGVPYSLQVIGDAEDRWVGTRRIWNQSSYHVTNVREDGTIPTHEPPSWGALNTYRTNPQIEGNSVCTPPTG